MANPDCTCVTCGATIQRKKIGRPPKYCGRACRPSAYVKNPESNRECAQCGGAYRSGRSRAKYCSPSCKAKAKCERARGTRVYGPRVVKGFCRGCCCRYEHETMHHGRGNGYCSRDCFIGRKARIAAEASALNRIASRDHGPIYPIRVRAEILALRRIRARRERKLPIRSACSSCGTVVIAKGQHRRVCEACKRAAYRRWLRETESGRSVRRADRAKSKAKRRLAIRARRSDSIDPIRVFEQFGWRCHLCREPTPRRLRGTYDPRAPELDHVVPLAAGGTHTYGNVACACRECNIKKGSRVIGQLGLDLAA